jgi:choline dehydrogenase-like flavoprotein
MQGCPTAQKQSMDVTYLPFALRKGARLYSECRVDRIERIGGRAGKVTARFVSSPERTKGGRATFRARKAVLLAASAIQTPLLLAASGIGGQSGLVGRRFQCHPGISLCGEFDEPVNMWESVTQGYESTHLWTDRLKFETVSIPLDNAAARLNGYGSELMRNIARFGHIAQWGVHVRSEAHGRIYRDLLGRTRIKYDMTDQDVSRLKRGLKLMARMLFEAGAKAIFPGVHGLPKRMEHPREMDALDGIDNNPNRYHGIASHMFGTAVMGADPARSVVGFDGQAHEMPGLYVMDSSTFPTNLGVNPQNSIIAWSWLTSEKLANA